MRIGKTNIEVILQFPLYDRLDGTTKVSGQAANFTKSLWANGTVDATEVTIEEIESSGEYLVSFTPDEGGFWVIEITLASQAFVWRQEIEVYSGTLDDLYKSFWNKLVLTRVDATHYLLQLLDTDDVTVIREQYLTKDSDTVETRHRSIIS